MKGSAWFTQSNCRWGGLVGGPVLAVLAYLLFPETFQNSQGEFIPFSSGGHVTAALGIWMGIWWLTEAIPVSVTALLPLAVLPITGAVSVKNAASPYGHELIFLFLGGFILALSLERWNLHKRFAAIVLGLVGTKPRNVVGGFMLITAVLSMWVSNTATTIMMLPLALSVIELFEDKGGNPESKRNFSLSLLLGIAYAASIGGIGTLIGTPPNLFLASYVKSNLGREISFVQWMGVGMPLVIVFLPIVWQVLTRLLFPIPAGHLEGRSALSVEMFNDLGPLRRGEKLTLAIFTLTALAWMVRPLAARIEIAGLQPFSHLSDTSIAVVAALLLFVLPVDVKKREFLMDWETAVKLPWGLLLLFGGGLSLAAAISATGVDDFIAHPVHSFSGMPAILLVVLVIIVVVLLTELTSNTATTTTMVPLLASLASGMGMDPYVLIVPAAMAASCAFMLPVATPPNAIVFGSGLVSIPEMAKAGLWFVVMGIFLITLLTYAVAYPLLM